MRVCNRRGLPVRFYGRIREQQVPRGSAGMNKEAREGIDALAKECLELRGGGLGA
jgi:hypothetical protein